MPLFLREILNAELNVTGVIFALLLGFFIWQMIKKFADIGTNKSDNAAINTKLDNLLVILNADKESIKEMKSLFGQLQSDMKEKFMALENNIKNAFDDLHKVKNIMQTEQIRNQVNQKEVEKLTTKVEKIEHQLAEIRAIENYRRNGDNHILNAPT